MTIQRSMARTISAAAFLVTAAASSHAQGVNIGGLIGGVGSLIQSGIQADLQRQQLEQVERIERLRLEQLRRQQSIQQRTVRTEPPAPLPDDAEPSPDSSSNAAHEQPSGYTVEGRHLGDVVDLSASDATFGCFGSDQFPGFQWCKRLRAEGKLNVQTAVLKSPAGLIAYYAKAFSPAHFRAGSIEREIAKLSSHYGTQARVMRLPAAAYGSGAVIATWGALSLEQVDASVIGDLAANRQVVAGVLVDFLGDARQSARQGLPVFRVAGGAGAFWAARYDRNGQGNLRFGISDASAFDHPAIGGPAAAASVPFQVMPGIAASDARTTGAPVNAPSPMMTGASPSAAPIVQSPIVVMQPAAYPPQIAAAPPTMPAPQAGLPSAVTAVQAPASPQPSAPPAATSLPPASPAAPPAPAVVAQDAAEPRPAPHPAEPEQRVALVIGNSAYRTVARLPNPDNDAEAVAGVLRSEGFTVKLVEDATLAEMKEALRYFQMQADNADWAVVYYAGHGLEISGQNYLIPVDAKLSSDQDADDEAVTLRYVLDKMHNARKLHLVILDACRDNPFQGIMKRQIATRGVSRGLAPYEPTIPNEMVVYAARGGEQAQDDIDAGGHSPFAKALVSRMAVPGVEINKVFRLVTADVLASTSNRQQPFVYGSTPGAEDFYFKSRPQ